MEPVVPESVVPVLQRQRNRTELVEFGSEVVINGSFEGTVVEWLVFMRSFGVTVSVPGDEFERIVMGDWLGVPSGLVVESVAFQLGDGLHTDRVGERVYVVGDVKNALRVARVFPVSGIDGSAFIEAVRALSSDQAQISSVGDIVVVRDTPRSIRSVDVLFNALMAARGQYLVEIRMVEISERWAQNVGVDWSTVGEVNLDVLINGGGLVSSGLAAGQVVAMLDAVETGEDIRLVSLVRLHCVEGADAVIQVGETTPIPRRAVSDAGTVSTTDFDYVDTGILASVSVRTEPNGLLRVIVVPEMSEVVGYVEGAPIRSRRRLETQAVVEPGGVVVLGGFSSEEDFRASSGLPFLPSSLFGFRRSSTRLFIVLRVFPVGESGSDNVISP